MGWKPRGILSPKLRYLSNPLTPGLVSRNLSKLHSKKDFYLFQSIPSISVFFICFQHKNSTLIKSGQGSVQESPYQSRTNQNLICAIPCFFYWGISLKPFIIAHDQSITLREPFSQYLFDRIELVHICMMCKEEVHHDQKSSKNCNRSA
jgi:hypothetical protein